MRPILSFSMAIIISSLLPAFAASDLDATAGAELRLLELKYFDHSFDADDNQERVERLEKLILGESCAGDLSERIKTMAAALQADGESLAPCQPDLSSSDSNSNKAPSSANSKPTAWDAYNSGEAGSSYVDRGNYPHISNLEKEILGKTYEGEALSDRLSRMESKAMVASSDSKDFNQRTERLEQYAEQVLHCKPFALNKDIDKIDTILVSRPGYPTAAERQEAQEGLQHFFNQPQQISDSLPMNPDGSVSNQLDDPAIYQKNPPPASARMLTRVAWCEMQIFGHANTQFHLTKRLRDLNDAVLPNSPKQSDMQLMDDLGKITDAVIARKSSQQSLSSETTKALR